MKRKAAIVFGLLALMVLAPLVLKRSRNVADPDAADDRLVILTPHNESIRREIGEAFAAWWRETRGRPVFLDWRTPGGMSEIRMVLDSGFQAAEDTGREGIGVDLLFGGGMPDFSGQDKLGRLAPLDVFREHPDWFGEEHPVPQIFTGELYFNDEKTWLGVCLSQFGICHNPAFLGRLGLATPDTWRDLTDPRYIGSLALADPTKSGSVARTFELIVQSEMLRELDGNPDDPREASIERGWARGLQLIMMLAANARYFTDSASKIPQEVGQGNAAAGMCIDFYGRSFAETLGSDGQGKPSLVWTAPAQGTTLSADPVAVLKGAPHPEIAQAFVTFLLTPEAQRIWMLPAGTIGGPGERTLHRLPIRRDVYQNPENPYLGDANLTYQPALTGKAFHTLRQIVKVMCIDSHEELKSAWSALIQAGMPDEALAVLLDVSFVSHGEYGQGNGGLDGTEPLATARHGTRLGERFRANFRRAEAMARSTMGN
jgi:ABC-type Fe3+ transport system substrate-binding protein